jgi:FkbM family methyltransferase
LQALGLDLKRYSVANDPHLRRRRLMEALDVDGVLDGGAHRGEYAGRLRRAGYAGPIASVEPQPEAFAALLASARRDPAWRCRRAALHAGPGTGLLRLARSAPASSLLDPTPLLLEAVPGAAVAAAIPCDLTTIDDVVALDLPAAARLLVKLDVQGAELPALHGGARTLAARAVLLELELPLRPLYAGAASFETIHAWLSERGWAWVGVAANTVRSNGIVLEVDALYARLPRAARAR